MPIQLTCPHCKKKMEAKDELVGARARCPHCRGIVQVVKPPAPKPTPADKPAEKLDKHSTLGPPPPMQVPSPEKPKPAAKEKQDAAKSALASNNNDQPITVAESTVEPWPLEPLVPKISALSEEETKTSFSAQPKMPAAPEQKQPGPTLPPPSEVVVSSEDPQSTSGAQTHDVTGLVLGVAGKHRRKRNSFLVLLGFFFKGSPTDASTVITGVVGILFAVLFYLFLVFVIGPFLPEPTTAATSVAQDKEEIEKKVVDEAEEDQPATPWLVALFTERGWVPYVVVWLSFWSMAILAVKLWKVTAQQAALSYDLLPIDAKVSITPDNSELVKTHLNQLPLNPHRSFLVNRILLALDHFKARRDAQDVGSVLNAQAEIDAAMVESSYSMLKVFIWAIPILGFIGTVTGISDAVSGFTSSIQAAEQLDSIRNSLGGVTSGLATAFDTTLIALILSLVIMFPTNSLQKTEESLLTSIDDYCNDELLRRLRLPEGESTDNAVEEAVTKALQAQQQEFQKWLKEIEKVEANMVEKMTTGLAALRQDLASAEDEAKTIPT